MIDHIYTITTWNQPQLVETAIKSLPRDSVFSVCNIRDEGHSSLAAAWNSLIKKYVLSGIARSVIIMNDDVECVGDTGKALSETLKTYGPQFSVVMTTAYAIEERGDRGFVWNSGAYETVGAFCFCATADLVEKIGWFDEEYERVYFEDTDMLRQIYLANYEVAIVAPVHHVGEATTKNTPGGQEIKNYYYNKNLGRYKKKWGGRPGKEIYDVPFNGEVNES